jgi:23S rRNA maturation-related 3'-5' exoribonuclease YhaM
MANRYFQKVKQANPTLPNRVGVSWSEQEETQLLQLIHEGKTHEEIGSILQRTTGGIKGRLWNITCQMYEKGISNDEISKVTLLPDESIYEAIKKHNAKKIENTKDTEGKVMRKEPIQAKLLTIPESDIMQLKLVMFEIRDLLRILVEKK